MESGCDLLSVEEAGKRLSISPWTVRAHIWQGKIRPVRLGRRVLIARRELERIATEGLPSLGGK
jgi:excisionase family DNA binding protein